MEITLPAPYCSFITVKDHYQPTLNIENILIGCHQQINSGHFNWRPAFDIVVLRHESRNNEQSIANKAEKFPMTLVDIEPGPPGQ